MLRDGLEDNGHDRAATEVAYAYKDPPSPETYTLYGNGYEKRENTDEVLVRRSDLLTVVHMRIPHSVHYER